MNNVNLVGRLTRDPELRYTTSGMAVVRFTLAVDRRMSREKRMEAQAKNQPITDFISCTAWNKTAELIANYVEKGKQLAIEGRIQTGSYEKNGQRIFTTDVVVNSMDFIEKSGRDHQPYNDQPYNNQQQPEQEVPDGFFPMNDEDMPF